MTRASGLSTLVEGGEVEQRGELLAARLASISTAALVEVAPALLKLLDASDFGRTVEPYGLLRAHVVDAVLRAGYPFALSLDPDDLMVWRREAQRTKARRLERSAVRVVVLVLVSAVAAGLTWASSAGAARVADSTEQRERFEPVAPTRPNALVNPAFFARFSALDEDLASARSDSEIAHAASLALALGEVGAEPLWALAAAWERRHRETGDARYLRRRDDALAAVGNAMRLAELQTQLTTLEVATPRTKETRPRLRTPTTLAAQAAAELETGELFAAADHAWVCAEAFPEATRCLALHLEARERMSGRLVPHFSTNSWVQLEVARSMLGRRLAAERLRADEGRSSAPKPTF